MGITFLDPPRFGDSPFHRISTLVKCASDLPVETSVRDFLRKLIEITGESAWAKRVHFLTEKEGSLAIEAEGVDTEVGLQPSSPHDRFPDISTAVVNEVRKTGRAAIASVVQDEAFAPHPLHESKVPCSILCVPVVCRGEPVGMLHVEIHLTAEAFTADRIEIAHALASLAAIRLENAQLLEEVKQEVERRRRSEEDRLSAREEVGRLKDRLRIERNYPPEIQEAHSFNEIVGNSPALLSALRKVEQFAPTTCTVLISGETGTGKELIARAIHERSQRKGQPIIKVSCGAIPAGLVESELFGHVAGAFTGALGRRIGRFEQADGGTIFLDEVGELPPEAQVKILRVLQEQEFEPVGSSHTVKVDIRIIAATNRDLESEIYSGGFRSDLFYRLNILSIEAPPLRERPTDIPPLVFFFLSRFSRKFGKKVEVVRPETMKRLVEYPWPGNIRELQNIIEREVVLSQDEVLQIDSSLLTAPSGVARIAVEDRRHPLGHRVTGLNEQTRIPSAPPPDQEPEALDDQEAGQILQALKRCRGVIEGSNGAAQLLDVHPNTLRSRMKKLGILRRGFELS